MSTITTADFKQDVDRYLSDVATSHEPLIVTGAAGAGNFVILPEEDLVGWQETVHLLRDPVNADHLRRSMQQAEAGEFTTVELNDLRRLLHG